jgi:hypothetical protein
MASSDSQPAMSAVINERLRAIEDQIRDLQSYVRGQNQPSDAAGVNVIQLSDEERAAIRSTLETNSSFAASALPGRKILVMVDPPGVCFDYSNF